MITVTSAVSPSISASINVVVMASVSDQEGAASTISVSPDTVEIPVNTINNSSYRLTAVVQDAFHNTVTGGGSVEWSSSNPDAVTVVADGSRSAYVNAIGSGDAEITASFTDTRYGDSGTITDTAYVVVTGGLEGISTDSDYYRFPVNYRTHDYEGENDSSIKITYNPADSDEKGSDAVSSDSSVVAIDRTGDNELDIITGSEPGTATITLSSSKYPTMATEITIDVVDVVGDADRIQSISLSRNSVTMVPPFNSSRHRTITAVTKVFDDKTATIVDGDITRFPVAFESGDPDIFEVR